MTFYYVPDVSRALLSVESLAYSVNNGWIMRSGSILQEDSRSILLASASVQQARVEYRLQVLFLCGVVFVMFFGHVPAGEGSCSYPRCRLVSSKRVRTFGRISLALLQVGGVNCLVLGLVPRMRGSLCW